VKGWDDFERLSFTTKADLAADQAAEPPFGTNLTFPLDHYVRLHQTSGSSGQSPLRWLDTAESWEWWRSIWAEHVYGSAGVGPRDRVFLAFSFGPFIGFWSAFAGAEKVGALIISGGAMSTEKRARAIMDLGATVLCSTPTYALRLAAVAQTASRGPQYGRLAAKYTAYVGKIGKIRDTLAVRSLQISLLFKTQETVSEFFQRLNVHSNLRPISDFRPFRSRIIRRIT